MNLADLEKKLVLNFKNKSLLRQSLIHRSYLNEHPNEGSSSNERLEFLGDAILEFVISKMLFGKFPDVAEGTLTALRSNLVRTESLAKIAHSLEIGEYLYLSRGEEESGGKTNQTLLANALEAVIGAIYEDKGIQEVSEFIERNFEAKISESLKNLKDCKSLLQEKAQRKEKITPSYKVLGEEGPNHSKTFTVGVYLNKKKLAEGKGHSKQTAEEEAARIALEKDYQTE